MDLQQLALGEKIALCRRAEAAVGKRLKMLARWADPEDDSLRQLFLELANDQEVRLVDIDRLCAWAGELPPCRVTDEDLDRLIRRHFPSLYRSTGEGHIQREAGTYLAQCLQEEAVRLYRTLADQATDGESRTFFLHWSREAEWDIDFIRSIILA